MSMLTNFPFVLKLYCVFLVGEKMNIENLNCIISDIEKNLALVKNTIEEEKNRQQFEEKESFDKMEVARTLKTIYSLFARGFNSYEVAEKVKDRFPSVWDAYYFVNDCNRQELARKRYARAYLVNCLAKNGFSKAKISKIAGCTPQRCGQIVKNAVF